MKKLLLIALTAIAALAVLAAAALACFFSDEALQTRAANCLVNPAGARAERARITASQILAENISYSSGAADISADKFVFNYSFFGLLGKKLSGSGKLEGVKISLKNSGAAKTSAAADAAKPETPEPANRPLKPAKHPFDLPIEIEISSFAADALIASGANSAAVAAEIKNLKIANKSAEFEISASLEAGGAKYRLEAAKSRKILNAKIFAQTREIFAASAETDAAMTSGGAKLKISAGNAELNPLAKAFGADLPEISADIFADISFDIPRKNCAAKLLAKCAAKKLSQTAAKPPFDACELSAEAEASLENSRLKIGGLRAALLADGACVASVERAPGLPADLSALKDSDWFDVCSLTISIPQKFSSIKIGGGEFSAENIGGVFLISANKIPQIKIKTTKPAQLANARFAKGGETLAERLSLFAEGGLCADFRKNSHSAEVEISSAIVDGKRLAARVKAEAAGGGLSAVVSAGGCANPLLYSINSVSSNLREDIFVKGGAKLDFQGGVEISGLDLSLSAGSAGGASLKLTAPEKISFRASDKSVSAAAPILLKADKFPFAPLRPFAGGLDAKTVSLDARADLGGKSAKIAARVAAEEISYTKDSQILADDLNLRADLKADIALKSGNAKLKIENASLSNSAGEICAAAAEADVSSLSPFRLERAAADISGHLPPIFALPALAKFNNITRAGASAKISIDRGCAKASLKLTNLAARGLPREIQTLSAEIKGALGGKLNISAKLSANSELGSTTAEASILGGDSLAVDLGAGSLVLDDILLVKTAFTNPLHVEKSSPSAQKAVRRPDAEAQSASALAALEKRDTKPFWGETKTVCRAKIGELRYGGAAALRGFSALAETSPKTLKISNLGAEALGGKLSGSLKIGFDASKRAPYSVSPSKLSLKNFDISKIGNSGFLTGTFSASIDVRGDGNNLSHLLDRCAAKAAFTGKNGSIRLIDTNADMGKKIGLAHAAAKLANAFLKNEIINSSLGLVERLSTIDFERAEIRLSRNSRDFDINVDSAEIAASDLVIKTKKGSIRHNPALEIGKRDLDIEMSIYTKNSEIISMLKSVHALASDSGAGGLCISESFRIYGTLENPKTNLLDILTGSPVISTPAQILKQLNLFK